MSGHGRHSPPAVFLSYSFEPAVTHGKLVMHTVLEFPGGPSEAANLEVPSAWGDATQLEKGITNLTSTVHGGHVNVSYDLTKDWIVPPPRADHHPILEPEYFEFNTQNALVHPQLESGAQVEVHFDWRKLPSHWTLATSFGAGKRVQRFRGRWEQVANALFAGGDFRLYPKSIAGRPLLVAIRDKWAFTDEEAAALIQKVISFERGFWNDHNFPYYLVTVSAFGRDDGAGGGAFTSAFALFLSRKSTFGSEVLAGLAHETFHTWNPYRMGALPSSVIAIEWFTEGFTRYYQHIMLLRAGMLAWPEYVERTNEILRKYLLSPARDISNREVVDRHRRDAASDDIPYSRGAVTALWLDATIRSATGGKSSLDNVMFDLVRQARGKRPELTAERVFRAAGKYIGADALRDFATYVETGKTVPIPASALGGCATLQMDDIPPFELGFDREALVTQHVISGVKAGSAAFQAGLRDGQQVTGMSIHFNDVSKPVRLTVHAEGSTRIVEYYPRGQSIGPVPQFHVNDKASSNPRQCVVGIRDGVN